MHRRGQVCVCVCMTQARSVRGRCAHSIVDIDGHTVHSGRDMHARDWRMQRCWQAHYGVHGALCRGRHTHPRPTSHRHSLNAPATAAVPLHAALCVSPLLPHVRTQHQINYAHSWHKARASRAPRTQVPYYCRSVGSLSSLFVRCCAGMLRLSAQDRKLNPFHCPGYTVVAQ